MSDLQTRIAQVLYARHQAKLAWGQPWNELRDTVQQSWLDTAAAVIAELGLSIERGQRSNPDGPLWGSNNRYTVHRWVTGWKADAEPAEPRSYCTRCGIPHAEGKCGR